MSLVGTNNNDPVWQRIDQHSREISELAQKHAALHEHQQATDERMDRMLVMMSEHRTESKAEMKTVMDKIDNVDDSVNQMKGGVKAATWIIGTFISIGSIVATLLVIFNPS